MCRSLRVLCAAPDAGSLSELKRAAAGAEWELVGGAFTVEELARQAAELRPDVVVLHARLGEAALDRARRAHPGARIVALGHITEADASASALEDVEAAVRGLPPPAGPVRR